MENIVGPDAARCQTSVSGQPTNVNADGGTVLVSITAARDCSWTAASESPWMQLSATSGQGDASLSVTVAPNELPSARSGAVVVNNQRLTVSQDARPCTFDLQGSSARMSSDGGRGSFSVTTATGCSWTANTSASWIRILSGSGSGTGTVQYEVSPNPGSSREASIAVADRQHTVSQAAVGEAVPPPPVAANCAPAVAPTSINVPVGGGPASIALTINSTCDWSASSSDTWVTFTSPTTGRGNATIGLQVAENSGPARAATITVAQQLVVVAQPATAVTPTCTYSVAPASRVVGAPAGTTQFTISTSDGCPWTAETNVDWISLHRTSGNGPGEVRYTFQINSGPSRTGTITAQGKTHTVRQEAPAPCTYQLDSGSRSFPAEGGRHTVRVTATPSRCAGSWSVLGTPDWVQVSGGSGSASGEFSYTVARNEGTEQRTATLSVGGQTHQITQAGTPVQTPTCTFQLDSGSRSFPNTGGTHTVQVTASPAGCVGTWQVSGAPEWVQVSNGSGSASGAFSYTVVQNGGTEPRTANLTVGNQTHQITQAGTPAAVCTYSIAPTERDAPAEGALGIVQVTTADDCAWAVTPGADWVRLAGSGGRGSGGIGYGVEPNRTGAPRTTSATIAGQSFTVRQQ